MPRLCSVYKEELISCSNLRSLFLQSPPSLSLKVFSGHEGHLCRASFPRRSGFPRCRIHPRFCHSRRKQRMSYPFMSVIHLANHFTGTTDRRVPRVCNLRLDPNFALPATNASLVPIAIPLATMSPVSQATRSRKSKRTMPLLAWCTTRGTARALRPSLIQMVRDCPLEVPLQRLTLSARQDPTLLVKRRGT